jgi:hypothetical protein
MEWTIRLEARTGWGEVTSYEIGFLRRGLHDLSSEGVGLALAEAKALLAELQQRIVQDQVAEYVTCARVCPDCMALRRLRDQRTRMLQTLFGTVTVAAPRIRLCSCADTFGMADMSFSPLADVLPDRFTAELCQLHAELSARHSFREAGRLLETFVPCSPPNHTSVRNRLHRVSSKIEAVEADTPPVPAAQPRRRRSKRAEIVVMIDGAHLRAVPGLNTRHVDVTVGKVETTGRLPRRFALAPMGTEQPAQAITAALLSQGWQPGRLVAVISDGEPALPNLVRTATGEPVRHILDWWHISMRVRHIEQALAGIYALWPTHQMGLDFVSLDVERLRHLIWNGYAEEASEALWSQSHLANEVITSMVTSSARRCAASCITARTCARTSPTTRARLSTTVRATGPAGRSRLRVLKALLKKSPTPGWPSASECAGRHKALTAWRPCVPRCWMAACMI